MNRRLFGFGLTGPWASRALRCPLAPRPARNRPD